MKEILTYEGYQKLSKKLEYLKLVRRQELAEHLFRRFKRKCRV